MNWLDSVICSLSATRSHQRYLSFTEKEVRALAKSGEEEDNYLRRASELAEIWSLFFRKKEVLTLLVLSIDLIIFSASEDRTSLFLFFVYELAPGDMLGQG